MDVVNGIISSFEKFIVDEKALFQKNENELFLLEQEISKSEIKPETRSDNSRVSNRGFRGFP